MRQELSLKDFYLTFRRYIVMIVATAIAGGLIGYAVMYFLITPKYSSQAELLVNQRAEQQIIQYSEVQTNIQLINTYRAIITGHSVLSQVDENLNGKYGIGTLSGSISVDQPENSQTFYITATMDSPEEAQEVVEEVLKTFEEIITEVYGHADVNLFILAPASYNPNPDSPRQLFYVIGGGIAGLLISVVTVLFVEIMDSTVKDNDFFAFQGLMNLGIIYENPPSKKKSSRSGRVADQMDDELMVCQDHSAEAAVAVEDDSYHEATLRKMQRRSYRLHKRMTRPSMKSFRGSLKQKKEW